MNGNSALLDSNIIIYLSKNELPFTVFDKFDKLFISVISYMEVLGFKFRNNEEENFVKELIDLFEVQFVDQDVAEKVIEIRKQNHISLPYTFFNNLKLFKISDGFCPFFTYYYSRGLNSFTTVHFL